MGRTAPLTFKRYILYNYSTNIGTEYFKRALYSPFFSLQNAVCFIMLTCLVPVLFTFYIQDVLKLKKHNSGPKGLTTVPYLRLTLRSPSISNIKGSSRSKKNALYGQVFHPSAHSSVCPPRYQRPNRLSDFYKKCIRLAFRRN